MNFYRLMLIFFYFWRVLQPSQAYEYCRKQKDGQPLCSKDSPHIVCDPDTVTRIGDVVGVVPMTEKMKRHFLHLHNAYRNNTACGAIAKDGTSYSKATRMRLLVWDDELAYIAQIHAQQCNMMHDKCRSTRRHPLSGQNLGYQASSKKTPLLTVASIPVKLWYDEYLKVTDVAGFAKLYPAAQLHEVGHFTQLVNDRVSRVGCALTVCKRPNDANFHYHTTCNYDYSNIQGTPNYDDAGEIGSKCKDWRTGLSSKYVCLCENTGEIFKNN